MGTGSSVFTFKSEFVVDKLKKNKGILWKSKIPFFWVANFFLQNRDSSFIFL